jgi:penicillin-binding protein 2
VTLGTNTPGRDLKARYLWLGLAMIAGLLVLAVNLYRLQIVHYEEYAAKSEDNFVKEIRLHADRGMIKDRRGEILVDGRPSYDLFITPAFCQRCATEVLPKLARWLGWDELQQSHVEQMLKAARGPQRFQQISVRVDLGRDEFDLIHAHKDELSGVDAYPVQHRNYRAGRVLAHVLGYMNEVTQDELERLNTATNPSPYFLGDYIGRRGLERYFEPKLRGIDGLAKEVVNARGESMGQMGLIDAADVVTPHPGNNLVLSIDARLQAEAETAFPGTAGAVVVLDVRTGFILALVSRPSFDPNLLTGRVTPLMMAELARDPLQPMVFRPVAQHYSPGSTFKAVTMLAAFQTGTFHPGSTANCTGGYRLGSRVWRCHKDSGHGLVDARRALQVSCDTWFYKVADTIGLDPIAVTGRALGLGSPTGISVVAEVPGIMPDTAYHDRVTPGGYTKGMALNSAIGQGDDNVTPLQLAMVYAAIANGGQVYQPQLVRRIETPDGARMEEFQPKLLRSIDIHPNHRKVIVDALTAVVNEAGGTAFRSRLKDVVIAGKTGTAQVARLGKIRLKREEMPYFQRDHAWFAAFAPADEPEIAVVVLNEHGGHGGSDAAPTAQAVFQKYFDLKKDDAALSAQPESTPLVAPPPGPKAPTSPVKAPPSVRPEPPREDRGRSIAIAPSAPDAAFDEPPPSLPPAGSAPPAALPPTGFAPPPQAPPAVAPAPQPAEKPGEPTTPPTE